MWKVIGFVLLSGALGLGVVVLVVYVAASHFATRQRKLGRWDAYGPLEESEAPPKGGFDSGYMGERAEVIGRWKGKLLRRRAPGEKP